MLRTLRREAAQPAKVVAVCGWGESTELALELDADPERRAYLVDVLEPIDAIGEPGAKPVVESVDLTGADTVVIGRAAQCEQRIIDQLGALRDRGVRVRTTSLFYDEWIGKLPLSEVERVGLMFDIGEAHRKRYSGVKRIFDVIGAIVLLPVLAVLWPVVAVARSVTRTGAATFSDTYVGRNGATFRARRFCIHGERLEAASPLDDGVVVAADGVSRILARFHLGGLPMLLAVVRGDMSFIGPIAEPPSHLDALCEKVPLSDLRNIVRPGLTGWAQTKEGYCADLDDGLDELQYDFYYLRHLGLRIDALILARSIRLVLRGAGTKPATSPVSGGPEQW